MQTDSIETLLLRHYGSTAQVPADLEGRLCTSVRVEAEELRKQEKSILCGYNACRASGRSPRS